MKVDQIIDSVKLQKAGGMQLHDCVQQAVQVHLQEDKEETSERTKRKPNIIIHGLKESSTSTDVDNKKEEADQIIDMMHLIECDNVSVNSMTRLGEKEDDSQNGKPRPIKLVLASE